MSLTSSFCIAGSATSAAYRPVPFETNVNRESTSTSTEPAAPGSGARNGESPRTFVRDAVFSTLERLSSAGPDQRPGRILRRGKRAITFHLDPIDGGQVVFATIMILSAGIMFSMTVDSIRVGTKYGFIPVPVKFTRFFPLELGHPLNAPSGIIYPPPLYQETTTTEAPSTTANSYQPPQTYGRYAAASGSYSPPKTYGRYSSSDYSPPKTAGKYSSSSSGSYKPPETTGKYPSGTVVDSHAHPTSGKYPTADDYLPPTESTGKYRESSTEATPHHLFARRVGTTGEYPHTSSSSSSGYSHRATYVKETTPAYHAEKSESEPSATGRRHSDRRGADGTYSASSVGTPRTTGASSPTTSRGASTSEPLVSVTTEEPYSVNDASAEEREGFGPPLPPPPPREHEDDRPASGYPPAGGNGFSSRIGSDLDETGGARTAPPDSADDRPTTARFPAHLARAVLRRVGTAHRK